MAEAVRQIHADRFSCANELQELEMRIAVTGDDAVAALARENTDAQVPRSEGQRAPGPADRSRLRCGRFADVPAGDEEEGLGHRVRPCGGRARRP